MDHSEKTWRIILLSALLGALSLMVFWPVLRNGFVYYDDALYVTANPHVTSGLTVENILWAFGTGRGANWHPLAWLSHMLDAQLFGLRPWGHHLTSLLFHTANAVLLFLLLKRLTAALWPSFFVAALFALHPLHVESVAWIAERKDVLSTCFFLLTLLAYARYVAESRGGASSGAPPLNWRQPRTRSYLLSLGLYLLGLLSKPMLVTLPFVLLLLDYWPLERIDLFSLRSQPSTLWPLVREKAPFFGLAFASSLVTFLIQDAGKAMEMRFPLNQRLLNVVVSYTSYLGKAFWPTRLAIFYPHPDMIPGRPHQWPAGLIAVAALLLAGICFIALLQFRSRPWLTVGWFWYLGTLVPVSGIVQVGGQAMADRYTYVPLVGIFVCVVWACAEAVARWPRSRSALVFGGLGALLACSIVSRHQLHYWRNPTVAFEHALAVTRDNAVAEFVLGSAYEYDGKLEDAVEHFQKAVAILPEFADAHRELGTMFQFLGRTNDALQAYQKALTANPRSEAAHKSISGLYWEMGETNEALAHCRQALQINPSDVEEHINLGGIFWRMGKLEEGLTEYKTAVRLEPKHAVARYNLGFAFASLGLPSAAIPEFAAAVQLKRDYTNALIEWGRALAGVGRFEEARAQFLTASELCPTNANLYLNLGNTMLALAKTNEAAEDFATARRLGPELEHQLLEAGKALARQGQFGAAAARFNTALRLQPDSVEAMSALAWLLATAPQAQARNGAEAVRWAEKACALTSGKDLRAQTALDAAYAEAGRFTEAVSAAEKTREIALAAGNTQAAQAAEREDGALSPWPALSSMNGDSAR